MLTHPYICLKSKDQLPDDVVKCWIKCSLENCPDGTVVATEIPPTNKNLQFYYRKINNSHCYITCLSRDLSSTEAGKLATSFAEKQPNNTYEVSWSQGYQDDPRLQTISEDLLEYIAIEAARMNHNRWVQTRMDEGWRFSNKHNDTLKTSPICRSWDSLPEKYKRSEFNRIKTLLEVFNQLNLRLVRK
jgi:hypothetical protein